MIALLSAEDPAYVREAAKRGVFAYLVDTTPEELQSAIDVTLQRFTQYHNLQGAFGRRAVIEQAKGILMARHSIDADKAFGMLREHSQHNGNKLLDVAGAIVDSHLLLVPATPGPTRLCPEPSVLLRRRRRPSSGAWPRGSRSAGGRAGERVPLGTSFRARSENHAVEREEQRREDDA